MSFPERRNRGERTSLRGSGKSSFEHGLRCRWLSGVRVRAQEKERDGHQSLRTPELKNLPHEGGSGAWVLERRARARRVGRVRRERLRQNVEG